jgi:hypothetical protein
LTGAGAWKNFGFQLRLHNTDKNDVDLLEKSSVADPDSFRPDPDLTSEKIRI